MGEKRYYWLKLQRDFFKRHDIRIVEGMDNGKDYILFYLKLLVESVDHEGNLRFSETIPYDEQMLSIVTNTNIDIVRSAMKVFTELGMIEMMEDRTIYMTEVSRMIGSAADNDHAKRQQRYRERQKALENRAYVTNSDASVTGDVTNSNESKSIEIEIEKEIDIDKEKKKDKKEKPPHHRYGEYKHVLLTDAEYERLVSNFGKDKITDYIRRVDEYCQQYGKSYSDYNLTIQKWIRNEKPRGGALEGIK